MLKIRATFLFILISSNSFAVFVYQNNCAWFAMFDVCNGLGVPCPAPTIGFPLGGVSNGTSLAGLQMVFPRCPSFSSPNTIGSLERCLHWISADGYDSWAYVCGSRREGMLGHCFTVECLGDRLIVHDSMVRSLCPEQLTLRQYVEWQELIEFQYTFISKGQCTPYASYDEIYEFWEFVARHRGGGTGVEGLVESGAGPWCTPLKGALFVLGASACANKIWKDPAATNMAELGASGACVCGPLGAAIGTLVGFQIEMLGCAITLYNEGVKSDYLDAVIELLRPGEEVDSNPAELERQHERQQRKHIINRGIMACKREAECVRIRNFINRGYGVPVYPEPLCMGFSTDGDPNTDQQYYEYFMCLSNPNNEGCPAYGVDPNHPSACEDIQEAIDSYELRTGLACETRE